MEHFFECLDADPMTAYSGCGDEVAADSSGATWPSASAARRTARRTSMSADDPPPTPDGHDSHAAVSAMQKAIRRADTEAAAYWAWQLEAAGLGAWCWRRLKIITSEDIGHAWPEGGDDAADLLEPRMGCDSMPARGRTRCIHRH